MRLRVPTLSSLAALLLLCAPGALAFGDGTPDESPPAEETVCEDDGLIGAAFGLCVAFCEANDCDAFPDKNSCEVLRDKYEKITGESVFPCEEEVPPPQP